MRNHLSVVLSSALLVVGGSVNAEAQQSPVAELGVMFWKPTPELRLSTDALAAADLSEVDFVQEFGIEKERFREFRAVLKAAKKHKIRITHVQAEYNAATTLRRTIVFGGQTFPISVPATADLKWGVWRLGYEWDFVAMDRAVVGLITELKVNHVSADVQAIGFGSELTDVSAPVPTIGGIARVYPHKTFSLTAEFTGFKVPGFLAKKITSAIDDDADAKVFDLDLYGTVNFGSHVGAQLGYRSQTADYLFDEDAGDLELKGWYFGGLVRF